MTISLVYWQLIACFLLEFTVYLEAVIKRVLHSIIRVFALFWNELIFSLFLFSIRVLCGSSGFSILVLLDLTSFQSFQPRRTAPKCSL